LGTIFENIAKIIQNLANHFYRSQNRRNWGDSSYSVSMVFYFFVTGILRDLSTYLGVKIRKNVTRLI